jgi:hypothetical protein
MLKLSRVMAAILNFQICVFGADDLKSIMCSHWPKFKKSSFQKPPSQLNCDFAGMIIGWSCTKSLVLDHPMIIPAKSQFNWLSGF